MSSLRKYLYWKLIRVLKRIYLPDNLAKLLLRLTRVFFNSKPDSQDAYNVRRLIDAILPSPNLVSKTTLPHIDLLICCSKKDSKNLHLVIENVEKYSMNPIRQINIVSPTNLGNIINIEPNKKIVSWLDSEIINSQLQDEIREYCPTDRFGWILQQALKISFTLNKATIPILIIDADTILCKAHTFLSSSGNQLLHLSYEFHIPYNTHANDYFKLDNKFFSYVTHFQLWQPDILKKMYPRNDVSLLEWLASGDINQESPVSEFHSYGSWLLAKYPRRVRITSWRNMSFFPSDLSNLDQEVKKAECHFGSLNSVSMHSYLDAP